MQRNQCCLPGPGRTEQAGDRAAGDLDRNIPQGKAFTHDDAQLVDDRGVGTVSEVNSSRDEIIM